MNHLFREYFILTVFLSFLAVTNKQFKIANVLLGLTGQSFYS